MGEVVVQFLCCSQPFTLPPLSRRTHPLGERVGLYVPLEFGQKGLAGSASIQLRLGTIKHGRLRTRWTYWVCFLIGVENAVGSLFVMVLCSADC